MYLAQIDLFVHGGHDVLVGGAWLHEDILGIRSGEPNECLLPSVKPCHPPRVDGSHPSCRDTVRGVGVVIVDWLHGTAEVELHVLLHQTSVKWTEVHVLVIHTVEEKQRWVGDIYISYSDLSLSFSFLPSISLLPSLPLSLSPLPFLSPSPSLYHLYKYTHNAISSRLIRPYSSSSLLPPLQPITYLLQNNKP